MGLFEKRNPRATRRGVIYSAIGGGVFFFFAALLLWLYSDMGELAGFLILPFMTLAGAVTGAAIEWQLSEDDDNDDAQQNQ